MIFRRVWKALERRQDGREKSDQRIKGLNWMGLNSRDKGRLYLGSCLGVMWIKCRIQREAMKNELTSGSPFEFWCKVVLYSSVSPRPFPFWKVCKGPERL